MRALLAAALLLVGIGTAAADPNATPPKAAAPKAAITEHARLEIKPPAAHAFTTLAIDNPLGSVRVEGYDGTSLQIETTKHALTDEALDRLRISLVPNPDGSVRISTTADGGKEVAHVDRADVQIDLLIRAPRDARIEASATAGTLEIVNMDAGGVLDTSSGRISVQNVAGEVSTTSVSGHTRLEQVFGSVDAETLSADLELDTINGQRLVASANHGKIAGRRVRSRDIELTTTDGAISIEAETGLRGRLIVASASGDVEVRLRRSGATVIRARGTKVSIGQTAHATTDGWMEDQLGTVSGKDLPAFVELQSRRGTVQLHLIETQ